MWRGVCGVVVVVGVLLSALPHLSHQSEEKEKKPQKCEVLIKWKGKKIEKERKVIEGADLEFECSVHEGGKVMEMKWVKEGKSGKEGGVKNHTGWGNWTRWMEKEMETDKKKKDVLKMKDSQESDSGVYFCLANTTLCPEVYGNFTLAVKDKWVPIYIFIGLAGFCAVTSGLILFLQKVLKVLGPHKKEEEKAEKKEKGEEKKEEEKKEEKEKDPNVSAPKTPQKKG